MRLTLRRLCRRLCIAALIACSYAAQTAANEGPVYQRHRSSATNGYGSGAGHSWHYPGYPALGLGLGYFQQPSSGYWFERPYPYHFDYYRGRFNSPAQNCPPAESLTPTPVVVPND